MNQRDLATLRRAGEIIQDLNTRLHQGESQWLAELQSGLSDISASSNTLERMAQRRTSAARAGFDGRGASSHGALRVNVEGGKK